MRKYSESDAFPAAGPHRIKNRFAHVFTGKIRAAACLTAVCIILSVTAYAEGPQTSFKAAASQSGNSGDSISSPASSGQEQNNSLSKRIAPKDLPKMEHRPRYRRKKHTDKDLVYDTLTEEEAAQRAEAERKAAEAAAKKSSSKKSSSKKKSSKKKSSKKKSSGGYKLIQY